jgi:transposase InsO family protein
MNVTTQEKIARRKLSLLELASDLKNVSKACKLSGYSRQQFYEIRRSFQTYGSQGLLDRMPGAKGPHPNRVEEAVEKAILAHSLECPTHGAVRVAQELVLKGVQVSSGGVRGVWSRQNLLTKHDRLMRFEKHAREEGLHLSDDQVKVLEKFSPEFRERHIETRFTGDLVAVDTFFVGVLKGVGRVYMQSVMDCYSRYAWGRLYTSKLPVTAVHILNEDVLPFFEIYQAKVKTVLSDNGREFCGRMDAHPYELFLQLEGIQHRKTQVRRPQSNGFVERFHKTILDEHFRIQGRSKWYESVEQMQADLVGYLVKYNSQRPHQGRNMHGRTPLTVFEEGLELVPEETEDTNEEQQPTAV